MLITDDAAEAEEPATENSNEGVKGPNNEEIENMDVDQQASNYVNRILVGEAGEVTKVKFFNELYGPAEKDAQKVYFYRA